MQNLIETFICAHSGIRRDVLDELMMQPDDMATDIGTILEGEDAVRVGLIDEVGGLSEALAALRHLRCG